MNLITVQERSPTDNHVKLHVYNVIHCYFPDKIMQIIERKLADCDKIRECTALMIHHAYYTEKKVLDL